MIELFSTGCPKCNILEKKLTQKSIQFTKNNNIDELIQKGFTSAPILKIGEEYLEFAEAIKYVNEVNTTC